MSMPDFPTADSLEQLALEVNCLKALFSEMLKAIGQADAGKVIIKMEKEIAALGDSTQAEVFSNTIQQIKQAYRQ